jgi:hypothetical protein
MWFYVNSLKRVKEMLIASFSKSCFAFALLATSLTSSRVAAQDLGTNLLDESVSPIWTDLSGLSAIASESLVA